MTRRKEGAGSVSADPHEWAGVFCHLDEARRTQYNKRVSMSFFQGWEEEP